MDVHRPGFSICAKTWTMDDFYLATAVSTNSVSKFSLRLSLCHNRHYTINLTHTLSYSYSENTKIVPLPQFLVIYCINLFYFSVAITDLSANTAIKLRFLYLFYSTAFIVLHLSNSFIIYIVNDSEYSKRIERMKAVMMYCITV